MAYRADERTRQQERRAAAKAAGCHGPASDAKYAELLHKLVEIVDRTTRLSRATFRRDVTRILREIRGPGLAKVDRAGGCHGLPCAMEGRENGSRSALDVDGVTDRYGAR